MWYVYLDWTEEASPRCFYVGKGTASRIAQVRRNKKHATISKQFGMRREVVFTAFDETIAFNLETSLIREYQTHTKHDGIGCNFTYGGQGTSGHKQSDRARELIRQAHIGLRRPHTQETRLKISLATRGKPSNTKGKKLSLETRAKMSASRKGKPKSDAWKQLMSERMKGNKNGMKKGKKS